MCRVPEVLFRLTGAEESEGELGCSEWKIHVASCYGRWTWSVWSLEHEPVSFKLKWPAGTAGKQTQKESTTANTHTHIVYTCICMYFQREECLCMLGVYECVFVCSAMTSVYSVNTLFIIIPIPLATIRSWQEQGFLQSCKWDNSMKMHCSVSFSQEVTAVKCSVKSLIPILWCDCTSSAYEKSSP